MLITVEKVALLRDAELFSKAPNHVLASVAAIAEEAEFSPGESFIHQNELETDMFLITDGKVRVHRGDDELAILESGEIVGEMEALSPAPRLASVSAIEPTRALRISKAAFDEVLATRFEIVKAVVNVLVQRLRDTALRD